MAATIVSMVAKPSDLEDQMSGANLQMGGHVGISSQSWKDPEEMGALGSSPSCSPSWSPATRLLPSPPNTRNCLGIHMTLTKETGVVPPLPHAWTAPLVEDMLCYARTDPTKAIVIGPDRAILFMGDSQWERAWVQAKLEMLHSYLQEWALGLANQPILLLTLDHPRRLISNCPGHDRKPDKGKRATASMHESINPTTIQIWPSGRFSPKGHPGDANSDHQLLPHQPPRDWDYKWCRRDQRLHHFSSPHLPWITGSKVIGIQYWWPHQCHNCQTGQKAPHIPDMADDIGRWNPHEDHFTHL